mmetsp:Transcript_36283/g.91381  ORF Transcript_36283/g.91381 Transcript_36283/m.91381 type:complete len:263 (+) Transcript_36283:312-1100(+)
MRDLIGGAGSQVRSVAGRCPRAAPEPDACPCAACRHKAGANTCQGAGEHDEAEASRLRLRNARFPLLTCRLQELTLTAREAAAKVRAQARAVGHVTAAARVLLHLVGALQALVFGHARPGKVHVSGTWAQALLNTARTRTASRSWHWTWSNRQAALRNRKLNGFPLLAGRMLEIAIASREAAAEVCAPLRPITRAVGHDGTSCISPVHLRRALQALVFGHARPTEVHVSGAWTQSIPGVARHRALTSDGDGQSCKDSEAHAC